MTIETRTAPAADQTVDATYRSVLVPLDGSDFAREALPTASELARRLGAPLEAVTVSDCEPDGTDPRPDPTGVPVHVVSGDDVAQSILTFAEGQMTSVVCMSTHGHGRVAGAFMGSVAQDLLRHSTAPIVVVGPSARPSAIGPDVPAPLSIPRIVACVDGTAASEEVLPTAAAWASRLAMSLTVLIVAEPAPMPLAPTTAPTRRVGHLDAHDAHAYVAEVADRWSSRAPGVTGVVSLDPISTAAGVGAHLRDHPAGLLAVSTHARRGVRRLWSGATASTIIHAVPVPVLVVPVAT